jgi:radical SAM protein with 4Fe4S-binding SPASM domain
MDNCNGFPQLGYGEFSQWLHRKVGNQHIPISGSFEVTLRCNLRCQHCYIPPERRASKNERELDLPEIQRILDEVTDEGCLWLLLTGGEPLLRRDFLDIYSYARRKGLILTLFMNGTLLTPRIADTLAEWRPFNIEITLYGATQETYERVTGIPGSYTRCRRGINLLLERKLPLKLKTMLMTLNRHELDQMKSFASSLGVEFRFDPILHSAIDSSNRPTFLRLTPEEIIEVEKVDSIRITHWPNSFREKLKVKITNRDLFLCGAGRNSYHIDAAGRISMCISNRNPSYDLRIGSFKEGWRVFLPQETSRQFSDRYVCAGCSLRSICAHCPAHGEIEHQDAEARVEYLCQLTKLRYETFRKAM